MIPNEILRISAARTCESYVSGLLSDYDPEYRYEFSAGFEKKIDRLKRRADHPFFYRTMRRIAVFILALLASGTIWIAIDTDARAAFFGWISDTISTYFMYHHPGEAEDSFDASDYRPMWLPDGYSEIAEKANEKRTRVTYLSDKDGRDIAFVYFRNQGEPSVFIEASDTKMFEVQVNGLPAKVFLSESDDVTSAITWVSSDDILFYVSGYLEENELIRIAESVQQITN